MKKLLQIFSFISILFMTVAYAENYDSSVKYTLNINSGTSRMLSYQVYKKNNKLKMIMPNMIYYINNTTNDVIIYLPQQKMAFKQNNNVSQKVPILDKIATDITSSKFIKTGVKNINGYSCTLYSNTTDAVDVCYSELYKMAVYMKTPTSTLTLTNIATTSISDDEFNLPTGVVIQSIPTMQFGR